MTGGATFTLIPWAGGQANVTATNAERAQQARLPMTELAKGSGWLRYSADGVYRYQKEEHSGWYVRHVPSGQPITVLAGLELVGFNSLANARRWTHTNPVPDGWQAQDEGCSA